MAAVTVAQYLLHRLHELGIRHVFGVPGDYNLGLLEQITADPRIAWIGACNELNAAYAADGYARINGLGALVTTFGVGELSAINAVAGSFAEYVPVVAITGAPATGVQARGAIMHHTLGTGDFSVFARMYERVTAAQAQLTAANAAAEIDRVLSFCLRRKQPVYISLPVDVAAAKIKASAAPLAASGYTSDPAALADAVDAVAEMLGSASRPVVLADVGVDRYRMHDALRALLDATGYPWATMTMGKGLLEESHPQFIGIYGGALSSDYVRTRIEDADAILTIGTLLTDFNTGGFSAHLDPGRTIEVRGATLRIRRALYEQVAMRDVLPALARRLPHRDAGSLDIQPAAGQLDPGFTEPFIPQPQAPITHRRFWHRLSRFVEEGDIVLAEAGTALFGAVGMPLPPRVTFISQLLWASIGYTLGAMVGTVMAAPGRRSVLLIGDGALQLTVQELSTAVRHGAAPIVIVLDNDGYTIERVIRGPDQTYNDIQPWRYARLPELFGSDGIGLRVGTEDELEEALAEASRSRDRLVLLDVVMDRLDCPDVLHRIGSMAASMNNY